MRDPLPVILSENLISEIEVQKLQKDDYSKLYFDMNYPIVKKINPKVSILQNRTIEDYTRYYASVYNINKGKFLVTSDW